VNIVFIGDIVGRSGRDAFSSNISLIKEKYNPDATIVNAENSASGYGLTKKIAIEIFNLGADVITLGNHAWDQREMLSYIEERPQIIRALNFPKGVPGKGDYQLILEDGRKILIIQVMLRLFMSQSLDDPFSLVDERLKMEFLGSTNNAILIDMHGEATSEKNAFGHFVDGKVTAVLGTHTHIPTSDEKILKNGTAYQTDVGMTGDYNSVIGMNIENPIHGFTKGYRSEGRFTPAEGKGKVCGIFVESDDITGLAKNIETFQI
jgi:2',3'-cyclic-nucleotide 2'-phosphodiesterase